MDEGYIRRRYGLDKRAYDRLLSIQGGSCPICERKFDGVGVKPCIDHDHITDEIRGLLCRYCNHRVVGRHRDHEQMQRVADYLRTGKSGLFIPKRKKRKRRTTKKARTRR